MAVMVGLDWGGTAHAVCVIDASGRVLDQFAVGHDRAGLAILGARLQQHGAAAEIAVAIERPSGLLVDALVDVGFRVIPIHPNLLKDCRPRYRAVAAKSDPGDALILADILRTDGYRLRPLAPQSDAIKALRGLVRGRDDLVRARVALANQLSGVLESFWPGAARIFSALASPIALAFLERYPTPESAARLGPKRLAGFLAQHQYCGRRSPEALLERLRGAPDGRAGEAEADARGELVRALARALQALIAELAQLTSRIEQPGRRSARRPGRDVLPQGRPGVCRPDPGRARRRARALPERTPVRHRGRRRPGPGQGPGGRRQGSPQATGAAGAKRP